MLIRIMFRQETYATDLCFAWLKHVGNTLLSCSIIILLYIKSGIKSVLILDEFMIMLWSFSAVKWHQILMVPYPKSLSFLIHFEFFFWCFLFFFLSFTICIWSTGLADHDNYHEYCRLLGRFRVNYQVIVSWVFMLDC